MSRGSPGIRRSAIDGRTTLHEGYALSQKHRKRIEEPFSWGKTVGGLVLPDHDARGKTAMHGQPTAHNWETVPLR